MASAKATKLFKENEYDGGEDLEIGPEDSVSQVGRAMNKKLGASLTNTFRISPNEMARPKPREKSREKPWKPESEPKWLSKMEQEQHEAILVELMEYASKEDHQISPQKGLAVLRMYSFDLSEAKKSLQTAKLLETS